jgi:hypothetical protein
MFNLNCSTQSLNDSDQLVVWHNLRRGLDELQTSLATVSLNSRHDDELTSQPAQVPAL